MKFVVDANILFSALIKDGKTAEIMVNNLGSLYVPDFIFEEFHKHNKEILSKTKRTKEEFNSLFGLMKEAIIVVPKCKYEDVVVKAEEVSPDQDDAPYFALALKLQIPIWSNDKKLKEQKHVRVYSTEELL